MAVSMADITKLRKMTGAGMMDCKNVSFVLLGHYLGTKVDICSFLTHFLRI